MLSQESGENLEYVIVRPGKLVNGNLEAANTIIDQTNAKIYNQYSTTRADLSRALVAAAFSSSTKNTTFELASGKPGTRPSTFNNDFFAKLDSQFDEQCL